MSNSDLLSTERFSDRVSDYSKYRPSYPDSIVEWLINNHDLNADSSIADIGSGTGIFTRLLVDKGLSAISVEPNNEMRAESDRAIGKSPFYKSVSGAAECTTLANSSINLIVAAQAFHWFDVLPTRKEFRRILSPNGAVALIWNRRFTSSDFQSDYELLLSGLAGYNEVKHTRLSDKQIGEFFGGGYSKNEFPYSQTFDFDSFKGRVFSSSYTPRPQDNGYLEFVKSLEGLFERYSDRGLVSFEYSTTVYSGCLR